jgi:hypothetical protein
MKKLSLILPPAGSCHFSFSQQIHLENFHYKDEDSGFYRHDGFGLFSKFKHPA